MRPLRVAASRLRHWPPSRWYDACLDDLRPRRSAGRLRMLRIGAVHFRRLHECGVVWDDRAVGAILRTIVRRLGASASAEQTSVLLAEYGALRTELERRASIQWNVVALQVSSAGVVASLAISKTSYNALLLILPLSSYVFGSRYILHDFHMKLINRYVQESLSSRLGGNLQWQAWKAKQATIARRAPLAVKWNVFQPTRLSFEGVAFLALFAALLAGIVAWTDTRPAWYDLFGLGFLWSLGVVALGALHVSFRRAS